MVAEIRRAWRGLIAAALVAACVDGPTAPGRFGGLHIQPTFAAGDQPATLGITVESAAVRITRPTDPGTLVVDTTMAYATDTSSFAWLLALQADAESLDVAVDLWGGGERLYSGSTAVEVRDDAVGSPAKEPVAVRYVGTAVVATVTVSPAVDTLEALGATAMLTAEARDRSGAVVPGAAFTWTSDDPGIATVDPVTGLVTAIAGGSATITATSGGAAGTARITVNPVADVASIAVTPATDTLLAVGATRQFTAQARDAGGNVLAGVRFAWSSSANAVATVDPASGLATATAHGTTTISAMAGSVSGQAQLTVDLSTAIASVTVSPASATLSVLGATQQFGASARDANGGVVPVAQFAWTSSDTTVGVIDSSGLAAARGNGITAITAAAGGHQGGGSLRVDLSAAVASITVTPASATLRASGATQQFTAVARDAAGTILPGIEFVWASADPAVASIDGATGLATALAHGITAVTATAGSVSGQAQLTVDLSLSIASVEVIPEGATLTTVGSTQQFTAVAHDAAGGVVPVAQFTWTSSDTGVAIIDPTTGLATATGDGRTTITAAAGGQQNSGSLRVDLSAAVASITVTPANATLTVVGATQQFTAVARDAAGTILPGVSFVWAASDSAVASIGTTSGLATAEAHGATTVTATAGSVSSQASLTVDLSARIAAVEVIPEGATLTAVGAMQQFTAVARDASGGPVPVAHFIWTSSDTTVGLIDSSGLATARGDGVTTITASAGGHQGSGSLRVDLSAAIATITVTPASATLTAAGATQQFTAQARDVGGNVLAGVLFTWSSSAGAVATVDPASGLATATAHGTTTISATAGSVSGQARLTVDLSGTIASVEVIPESATLSAIGATQQFTAVARDAAGSVVPVAQFTWTSSDAGVAIIDPTTGLATATGDGRTTITAAAGGQQNSGSLRVDLSAAVASITVTPASATLRALGATQLFTAVARDAAGRILPGIVPTWSSSVTGVASIGAATGLATAVGQGTTTITATVGSVSGQAQLAVNPDDDSPPAP